MDILGFGMTDGAVLRMHASGKAVLSISAQKPGHTEHSRRSSQRSSASLDDIQVRHGDTDRTFGLGTYSSRSTPVSGAAAAVAARKVRDKARLIAAGMLETSPEDLVWEKGRDVKGDPEKGAMIEEIAENIRCRPAPRGCREGARRPIGLRPAEPHLPVRSLHLRRGHRPETAEVKVRRHIGDAGVRINPMVVDGQIMGGLAEGVVALMEVISFDEQGNASTGR